MFGAGAAAGDDDDDGGEGDGDEGAKATALGTKGEEKGASKAKKVSGNRSCLLPPTHPEMNALCLLHDTHVDTTSAQGRPPTVAMV